MPDTARNIITPTALAREGQGFDVPEYALSLITELENAGHEAWIVGGFVRDSLRGVNAHDVDMACSAPWEETARIVRNAGWAAFETGTAHGTVSVHIEGSVVEVTTFRNDGTYADHRHPTCVTFVNTIEEDLARRDFTINAMAYHPVRGLLDPFGGRSDLEAKTLRCVGTPQKRFEEDALRMVRALRFASQLEFALEEETAAALFECKDLLGHVAGERLFAETEGLLCGSGVRSILIDYVDVLGAYIPELPPMKGLDQRTRYHIYDVLEHTAHVVASTPPYPLARWAALFHDAGKPDTYAIDEEGIGHMYGHPEASVKHLRATGRRLRFPSRLTHDLELLVRYHDTRPAATRKSVRKLFVRMEGNEYLFRVMCDLMRADALGHAPFCHTRVGITDEIEGIFDAMIAEEHCFSLKDLPVSGSDLIELGIPQGPLVGEALQELFQAVLDEEVEAERDALLERARTLAQTLPR